MPFHVNYHELKKVLVQVKNIYNNAIIVLKMFLFVFKIILLNNL